MTSPIESPIPFNPLDLIEFKLKFSKEQIEEIKRLEDDSVKEGEGKVLRIKTGIGKEGKCIVFKEKEKIVLVLINSKMEAKSITFTI